MRTINLSRKLVMLACEIIITYVLLASVSVNSESPYVNWYNVVIAAVLVSSIYAVREKIKNKFIVLVLISAICVLLCFLNIRLAEKIGICLIGCAQYAMACLYISRNRTVKPITDRVLPYIIAFVPWYIYITDYGIMPLSLKRATMSLAIVLTILIILSYYLDRVYESVKCVDNSEKDQYVRLFAMNNKIIMLILVVFGVLGTSKIYGLEKILAIIGDGIIRLVFFILRMIYKIIYFLAYIFGVFDDPDFEPMRLEFSSEPTSNSLLTKVIVGTVVGFILIFTCYKVVKFILMKNREDKVESTESDAVVTTYEKLDKEKKQRGKSVIVQSKIRQYYKQKINSYRHKVELNNTKTCDELKNNIAITTGDDVSELTDIYESIRYGGEESNEDLVKRAKRLRG